MGRPPKSNLREDHTHPLSSLSKDPIVREFMNEYWGQQQNVTPLVPIPRDKTKVEYIDAAPIVSEEEKEAYREREANKLHYQENELEKTKLRSEIKELHTLKNIHLEQLEEYRKRQEMYESALRHFLDKDKYKPSTIYTREEQQQVHAPLSDPAVEKVERKTEMMHGLPKDVYLRIRDNMFGKK